MHYLYKKMKLVYMVACLLLLATSLNDVKAQCALNGIYFSEVLPDPNSATDNFDTDGNGTFATGDEFLELTNSTGAAVDISGWTVYTEGGPDEQQVYWTAPGAVGSNTTCMAANGSIVLVNDWDIDNPNPLPVGFFEVGGSLGNGGEVIVMCDNGTTNTCIKMTYNGAVGAIEPAGSVLSCTEDFGSDTDGQSISNDNAGTFTSGVPSPTGSATACAAAACSQTVDTPAADTVYLCDGDDASAAVTAAEATIAYSGDGSVFTVVWYTDAGYTTPYTGTPLGAANGCSSTEVTLYAQATCSDDGSTVDAGTLTANVYPSTIPFTIVDNGCDVEISDDCGYAASYTIAVTTDVAGGYTDGDTGAGYACPTAQPTEAGTVTYTITDPDVNRPAACNDIMIMVPFSCGLVCTPSITTFPVSQQ